MAKGVISTAGTWLRRAWMGGRGWVRGGGRFDLLFLFGVCGLVVGGNLSLDVQEPLYLVVIGAVLAIMGVFGRDWDELWGQWGDRKVGMKRGHLADDADKIASDLEPAINSLEELMQADEISAEVKDVVSGIIAELDEKKVEVEDLGLQLSASAGTSRRRRQTFRASHQFGMHGVSLRLEAPAHHTFVAVQCTVRGPKGTYTAIPARMERAARGGPGPTVVYVNYPKDFGAPFARGEFHVEWTGSTDRYDPKLQAATNSGFRVEDDFHIRGLEALLDRPDA